MSQKELAGETREDQREQLIPTDPAKDDGGSKVAQQKEPAMYGQMQLNHSEVVGTEPIRPTVTKTVFFRAGGRLGRFLFALLMATALTGIIDSPAHAAAYPKNVYSPEIVPPTWNIRGWADLNLDCSGTYGCWNYMKIERSRWYGPEFMSGGWVGGGWQSATATLQSGCWDYRTTAESYNDVAGSYGSGVNIGPVGVSANGTTIYRFKTSWSSGWKRWCR
jgi:hypothetical protein